MRVLTQWKLLAALSAALLPASLVRAQDAPETKPADADNPPAAKAPAQPTDATSSAPAPSTPAPSAEVQATTPSASADANVQTPPAPSTSANATVQSETPATSTPPASNQPAASTSANSTQLNANVNNSTQLNANVNAQTNLNTNTQLSQQNLIAGLQFGQPTAQGLAIATLNPSNVFYTSGLRQGDVIVSYNGQPIRSQADFSRIVTYVPGQRVPVIVWRNGQQQTLYVTYQSGAPQNHPIPPTAVASAFLGVTFEPNPNAAIVRAVTPGSPAEHAGLQPGDMLVALNGNRVNSSQHVTQIVSSMQPGERLDIEFARRVNDRAQAVLAARPGQVPLTARVPAAPDTNVVVPERRTAEEPVPGGRLGDTDGDGRVLDRDGAINRRGRLIPPRD